jgi:hypothetical protein
MAKRTMQRPAFPPQQRRAELLFFLDVLQVLTSMAGPTTDDQYCVYASPFPCRDRRSWTNDEIVC